jgi:hypothetical protein
MATLTQWYVDPDTQGWVLDDYHEIQTIEASLGYVYEALMTEKGSIEELPTYGSNLRKLTHITPGITKQVESAIDECLRPMVGVWFDSYKRKCWLQNGAPLFQVEIKKADATSVLEIPLTS